MSSFDSAMSGESDLTNLDLFVEGREHDVWRHLRAKAPISWNEGTSLFPGFWSITKYKDILSISRDTATFSSVRGITMMADPNILDSLSGGGRMIITMDPPLHARFRGLVDRAFTVATLARLEKRVRGFAQQIIERIVEKVGPIGNCDFVTDIASQLPSAVISEILGVKSDDQEHLFNLTNKILGAEDLEYQYRSTRTDNSKGPKEIARRSSGSIAAIIGAQSREPRDKLASILTINRAKRELFDYFARLLAMRRREAGKDLISLLAYSRVDGDRLTDEEILYFCYLLILTGNETTRNAISGGMLALIEHPDQRALLTQSPKFLSSAVEEILRWTSPVMHMARVATRDSEVRGTRIRTGEKVLLWYPSANRDEEVFADADRFEVRRAPNQHIAFGVGEHFCLGATLARLELRTMFEELLRLWPRVELVGEIQRLRSAFIGGIKHMPVRFIMR